MAEKYSVSQAVRDVCLEMSAGENVIGYELYNRVLSKMRINGNRKHPLDSTVLRQVRKLGSLYGVKAKRQGESVYVKEVLF